MAGIIRRADASEAGVRGTVRDCRGRPMSGVRVALNVRGRSGCTSTFETGPTGEFDSPRPVLRGRRAGVAELHFDVQGAALVAVGCDPKGIELVHFGCGGLPEIRHGTDGPKGWIDDLTKEASLRRMDWQGPKGKTGAESWSRGATGDAEGRRVRFFAVRKGQ